MEEDTHICLSCRATIIGLDNYICHKKVGCSTPTLTNNKDDSIAVTTNDEPETQTYDEKPVPKKRGRKRKIKVEDESPMKDNDLLICDLNEETEDQHESEVGNEVMGTFTDFLNSLDLRQKSEKPDDDEGKETTTEFSKSLAACLSSITYDTNLPITNLLTNLAFDSDSELENLSDYLTSGGEDNEEDDDDDNDDDEYPPTTYTGGKWKPGVVPPIGYTGGKWGPGMGEGPIGGKRVRLDEETAVEEDDVKDENVVDVKPTRPKRQTKTNKVEDVPLTCLVCSKTYTSTTNLANHLVSQYHLSRVTFKKEENDKMMSIFKDLILKKKPFQCAICNFNAPSPTAFQNHFEGQGHADEVEKILGPQYCMVCKFCASNNEEMVKHLSFKGHLDMISLLPKNRPVVIKERRKDVTCSACGLKLHSVSQLKRHLVSKHSHIRMMLLNAQRQNVCIPCGGKKFSSRTALAIHMRRRHTRERPFTCELCNKSYCDKFTLKIHEKTKKHIAATMKILNQSMSSDYNEDEDETEAEDEEFMVDGRKTKKKKYKCSYCDFVTNRYTHLRPHFIKDHAKISDKCEVCDVLLFGEKEKESHNMSQVHMQLEDCIRRNGHVYICETCNKRLATERQYILHQLSHETLLFDSPSLDKGSKFEEFIRNLPKGNSAKKLKCPECHKEMAKSNLIPHLRNHENRKPFQCLFCSKSYTSASILRRHIEVHLGFSMVVCDECGKQFTKPGSLKAHKDNIHSNLPRIHECDICNHKFMYHWQLTHHVKIHGQKKLTCDFKGCSLLFRTNSDLVIHKRVHTNERPYLCDLCGYAGKSQNQLTRHKRTHTGERKFSCQYCPYKAMNSTHLRRHMRIHIGSKPYSCPYCSYACNTHENIRKHILNTRKHAGLKIYPCAMPQCSFGTNEAKEYRNHMIDVHKDEVKLEDTAVTSVFSGLYNKQSDPKNPAEGARIIQAREKSHQDSDKFVKNRNKKVAPVAKRKSKLRQKTERDSSDNQDEAGYSEAVYDSQNPSELVVFSIPKSKKVRVDDGSGADGLYQPVTLEVEGNDATQYILQEYDDDDSDSQAEAVEFIESSSIPPHAPRQFIDNSSHVFASSSAADTDLVQQVFVNTESSPPSLALKRRAFVADVRGGQKVTEDSGDVHKTCLVGKQLKQPSNLSQIPTMVLDCKEDMRRNVADSETLIDQNRRFKLVVSGDGDTQIVHAVTDDGSRSEQDIASQESMAIQLLTQLSSGQYEC